MSEIKGQLLGVLLVITIFAGVSVALIGAFTNATTQVADLVEAPIEEPSPAVNPKSNFTISYKGL